MLLVMHAKSGVNLLGKWKSPSQHSMGGVMLRIAVFLAWFVVLIVVPHYAFPGFYDDAKCTTRGCISAAFLAGTNHLAAGLLWAVASFLGFCVCMFIIYSWELVKRAWRVMLRAIGSL